MDATASISQSQHTPRDYRPDIDGLRALAVVPVVLFHAGLRHVPGGFTGVDIFFVISGYLITGHLYAEGARGRLSIGGFYARRIRRIAPALLTVLLVSSVAAWLLLFPRQLIDFAKALLSTEIFSSNFWFWGKSDYFAATTGVSPLLHIWSLAVEEQFYLVIPLLVGLLVRRPAVLKAALILGALISFALSWVAVIRYPITAFYLIPTRAWELLVGSVIAVGAVRPPWRQVSAVLGLALILAGICGLTQWSVFPGPTALFPCIGAGLLIASGGDTLVGRALAIQPLRFVGLISYSLYLWHWPVIVFARQEVGGPLRIRWLVLCVLLSFVLATASWGLVEKPTRDRRRTSTRTLILSCAGAALALAAVAVVAVMAKGAPSRFPQSVVRLEAASDDYSKLARACGEARYCRFGSGPVDFIFAGDSHAGALSDAIDYATRVKGRGGEINWLRSCPALIGWQPTARSSVDREDCRRRNDALFDRLRTDPSIRTLVIAAYWRSYFRSSPLDVRPAVARTAGYVRSLGKRLVILQGLPEAQNSDPWALAVAAAHGRPMPRIAYEGPEQLGVAGVDLGAALCPGRRCMAEVDGHPMFKDDNHLTREANLRAIGPWLARSNAF